MKAYTRRRQAAIAEYIASPPSCEQCAGVDQILVSIRFLQWWNQDLTREEEGNGSIKGAQREGG